MELALGTVQFGLPYGIAGTGQAVSEDEVRSILACAWERGVRVLDTAAAYGDIEQRLTHLCAGRSFKIISKIPAIPSDLEPAAAASWGRAQAEQSRKRLGESLVGLMFHRAEDLLGPCGLQVWNAVMEWADAAEVQLGASCYEAMTCLSLQRQFHFSLAQLPGNALDQRVATDIPDRLPDLTIYLRSVFLQGLLVMPPSVAQQRLPAASAVLQRWYAWHVGQGLSPLRAALALGKSFKAVSAILVGVDSLHQFSDIADAWDAVDPRPAPQLAVATAEIIDPRHWKL
jgi:aryl-alcohol dehydrogenase-like predicted oxidoreductase